MKTRSLILSAILFSAVIFPLSTWAVEPSSFRFADRILAIEKAGEPVIFEDAVIFTASDGASRVGVSFRHEDFARVHWFKRLYKPVARIAPEVVLKDGISEKDGRYDSGVLFLVYEWPVGLESIEYRMVIDGVWTRDPWNSDSSFIRSNGLTLSRVSLDRILSRRDRLSGETERLPPRERDRGPIVRDGTVRFSFESGVRGERITIAGNFNAWDPFMYELEEIAAGLYSISLPLPPGDYSYIFYRNGRPLLDDANPLKVYGEDGRAVSRLNIRP